MTALDRRGGTYAGPGNALTPGAAPAVPPGSLSVQVPPRIRATSTPETMPQDRIPPGVDTPINLAVSGFAIPMIPLTVSIAGAGAANGTVSIDGAATASVIASGTLQLRGLTQTTPGNGGKLSVVVSQGGTELTRSSPFSVAAVPQFFTDAFDSDVTGPRRGMAVQDGWESDSGSIADLDEVDISEQVETSEATGCFAGVGVGVSTYLPADAFTIDTHSDSVAILTGRGHRVAQDIDVPRPAHRRQRHRHARQRSRIGSARHPGRRWAPLPDHQEGQSDNSQRDPVRGPRLQHRAPAAGRLMADRGEPQLFVRQGNRVVSAPATDVAVAAGYEDWADKGAWIDGRRLTIMVDARPYRDGDVVRVIHVLEVSAGHSLYAAGPKPVKSEYVDGRLVTPEPVPGADPLDPTSYDGPILAGPGVDFNWEITEYELKRPRRSHDHLASRELLVQHRDRDGELIGYLTVIGHCSGVVHDLWMAVYLATVAGLVKRIGGRDDHEVARALLSGSRQRGGIPARTPAADSPELAGDPRDNASDI